MAGLEVIRTLIDLKIETDAPIEVVVWTNEEGLSRFPPYMMGSGVFAGKFDLQDTLDKQDEQGLSVGAELQRIGYAGSRAVLGHPVGAYFEAHIEQDPGAGRPEYHHRRGHGVPGPEVVRPDPHRCRSPRRTQHRCTCARTPWSAPPRWSARSTASPINNNPRLRHG